MITVLDVETTFKVSVDNKLDSDPHTGNMLVSVGYDQRGAVQYDGEEGKGFLCFYH